MWETIAKSKVMNICPYVFFKESYSLSSYICIFDAFWVNFLKWCEGICLSQHNLLKRVFFPHWMVQYCFDYSNFVVNFEIRTCESFNFLFLVKIVLAIEVPGWLSHLSVWLLISAQIMISGFWDWALRGALHWVWSPLGILSSAPPMHVLALSLKKKKGSVTRWEVPVSFPTPEEEGLRSASLRSASPLP